MKGYVPTWSKEVFVIKNDKNTMLWTYVISDLKGEFRVEKAIIRKGDKLHVKLKGYNNLFYSWIHKKYIIFQIFRTKIFCRKSESWIGFV